MKYFIPFILTTLVVLSAPDVRAQEQVACTYSLADKSITASVNINRLEDLVYVLKPEGDIGLIGNVNLIVNKIGIGKLDIIYARPASKFSANKTGTIKLYNANKIDYKFSISGALTSQDTITFSFNEKDKTEKYTLKILFEVEKPSKVVFAMNQDEGITYKTETILWVDFKAEEGKEDEKEITILNQASGSVPVTLNLKGGNALPEGLSMETPINIQMTEDNKISIKFKANKFDSYTTNKSLSSYTLYKRDDERPTVVLTDGKGNNLTLRPQITVIKHQTFLDKLDLLPLWLWIVIALVGAILLLQFIWPKNIFQKVIKKIQGGLSKKKKIELADYFLKCLYDPNKFQDEHEDIKKYFLELRDKVGKVYYFVEKPAKRIDPPTAVVNTNPQMRADFYNNFCTQLIDRQKDENFFTKNYDYNLCSAVLGFRAPTVIIEEVLYDISDSAVDNYCERYHHHNDKETFKKIKYIREKYSIKPVPTQPSNSDRRMKDQYREIAKELLDNINKKTKEQLEEIYPELVVQKIMQLRDPSGNALATTLAMPNQGGESKPEEAADHIGKGSQPSIPPAAVGKDEIIYAYISSIFGKISYGFTNEKGKEREELFQTILGIYRTFWSRIWAFLKIDGVSNLLTAETTAQAEDMGRKLENAWAEHEERFKKRSEFVRMLVENEAGLTNDPANYNDALGKIKDRNKKEGIEEGEKRAQTKIEEKEAEIRARVEEINRLNSEVAKLEATLSETLKAIDLPGMVYDPAQPSAILKNVNGRMEFNRRRNRDWPSHYLYIYNFLKNSHDQLSDLVQNMNKNSPFYQLVLSLLRGDGANSSGVAPAWSLIQDESKLYQRLGIKDTIELYDLPLKVFYEEFMIPFFIKDVLDRLNALYHYNSLRTTQYNLSADMQQGGIPDSMLSRIYGKMEEALQNSFGILLDDSIHLGRTTFNPSKHKESGFVNINRIGNNHYIGLVNEIPAGVIYDVLEAGFVSEKLGIVRKSSVGIK